MSNITLLQDVDIIILSFLQTKFVYDIGNTNLYETKLKTSASPLSRLTTYVITNDLHRLQQDTELFQTPESFSPLIHPNLVQTSIKHSSPKITQFLLNNQPKHDRLVDNICEHCITATHSAKPKHLKLLLSYFTDTTKTSPQEIYYLRSYIYTNIDYCFNYAYSKDLWQLVNIFVNNKYVNDLLQYINPNFKNLLFKFYKTKYETKYESKYASIDINNIRY